MRLMCVLITIVLCIRTKLLKQRSLEFNWWQVYCCNCIFQIKPPTHAQCAQVWCQTISYLVSYFLHRRKLWSSRADLQFQKVYGRTVHFGGAKKFKFIGEGPDEIRRKRWMHHGSQRAREFETNCGQEETMCSFSLGWTSYFVCWKIWSKLKIPGAQV